MRGQRKSVRTPSSGQLISAFGSHSNRTSMHLSVKPMNIERFSRVFISLSLCRCFYRRAGRHRHGARGHDDLATAPGRAFAENAAYPGWKHVRGACRLVPAKYAPTRHPAGQCRRHSSSALRGGWTGDHAHSAPKPRRLDQGEGSVRFFLSRIRRGPRPNSSAVVAGKPVLAAPWKD